MELTGPLCRGRVALVIPTARSIMAAPPEWFTSTHRLCRGCYEIFVGQRAFDMHQWDDGRTPACKPKSTWSKKLHWSEDKLGWRQPQPT